MVEAEGLLGSDMDPAAHIVIKGKRTKRQRPLSPLALALASCSSSAGEVCDDRPATSGELFADSTEEDEDMAHCLILLARGHARKPRGPKGPGPENDNYSGYQCRTCDRSFPSFQALGGHRASHKKPRVEGKKTALCCQGSSEDGALQSYNAGCMALSLRIGSKASCSLNNKSRVHECAICGAEFSSGQALGGHMRRHRPNAGGAVAKAAVIQSGEFQEEDVQKPKSFLSLDLNLPAPEDQLHVRESKFIAPMEQCFFFG